MLNWFLNHFVINEYTIAMLFVFSVVVLYESKTGKPITFIFNNSGLFSGTTKQKVLKWVIFLIFSFFLIWHF